ncbi:lipoprotein [Halalkalibacter urbisdiaboli]
MRKITLIFVLLIALVGCNQEKTKVNTPSNTQENVKLE